MSVSVVIATLGGDQLLGTIKKLNSGSLVPSEILISIPEGDAYRVDKLAYPNVRIVKTDCRGQVAQRAKGFLQTKHPVVLQLDDDIQLKQDALQKLAETLARLGPKHVVGPVFLDINTGAPLSPFPVGFKGFLADIYHSAACALPWGKARMGTLSSICTTASVDPRYYSGGICSVQWLAGGCVLGFRAELITHNFFPFEGKAYAEDGLHSYLRTRNGIKHKVVLAAFAEIEPPPNIVSRKQFLEEMKVRLSLVELMGGSRSRKLLFVIVEGFRRLIRKHISRD